ncbi:hypothetical protein ES705_11771 [subsurface metagenome]
MSFNNLKQKLVVFFKDLQSVNRNKATGMLAFEVMELENIFTLLLFGSFTGMPSPPVHITLQLLPLMERELKLMFSRINVAHDGLAEVVSTLGEP